MNKTQLLLTTLALMFLASCKKEVTTPNNGIYRGVFMEIDSSGLGDTLADGVLHMALFESNQTFAVKGDTNTMAPASHNGSYVIDAAGLMIFDTPGTPNPQYDPDHYLDTAYTYTFDDVNFTLQLVKAGKLYRYDMVRN